MLFRIPPRSIGRNPVHFNVTLPVANTEYGQALPLGTKKVTLKERIGIPFRMSYATGRVAAPTEPYETILANQTYWEDDINLVHLTLYFAAALAGAVIEMICWTGS